MNKQCFVLIKNTNLARVKKTTIPKPFASHKCTHCTQSTCKWILSGRKTFRNSIKSRFVLRYRYRKHWIKFHIIIIWCKTPAKCLESHFNCRYGFNLNQKFEFHDVKQPSCGHAKNRTEQKICCMICIIYWNNKFSSELLA